MYTLFISHASRDDTLVRSLEDWLQRNGFTDFFADHSAIKGGDKWVEELRRATARCRVVLCLVTESWLESDNCFVEFLAARLLGRRIIPLFRLSRKDRAGALDDRLRTVRREDQGYDFTPAEIAPNGALVIPDRLADGLKAGLRAGGALVEVGLDPAAFDIDIERRPSPFPGLESFGDEDCDAAIFFGRSTSIARCLEELRALRASGNKKVYALVGSSGSGKSSLLKAGVLPRLRRERSWLVLRSMTPSNDPLLEFVKALFRTFPKKTAEVSPGGIRDELIAAWHKTHLLANQDWDQISDALLGAFRSVMARFASEIGAAQSTLLITIDQAEELARAESSSAACLCDYCAALTYRSGEGDTELPLPTNYIIAITVRSDTFEEIQHSPVFQRLILQGSDIRPLSLYRVPEAIEEPARRYGVMVDKALVEAIMADMPDTDALPLTAFCLERIWSLYRTGDRLPADAYSNIRGLTGLLETAAERALAGISPTADDVTAFAPSSRALVTAARSFVPPLAQVDDRGAAMRRAASWQDFDPEARSILEKFLDWHLLVLKGADHQQEGTERGPTVEVAHESLFRSWPRLAGWLAAEKDRLLDLRRIQGAAQDWNQAGRTREFCVHRGSRLRSARRLVALPDFRKQLSVIDVDYLAACDRLQRKRNLNQGAGAFAVVVVAVAVGFGFDAWASQAEMRSMATRIVRAGYPTVAVKYAIAGAGGRTSLFGFFDHEDGATAIRETGFSFKILLDLPVAYSASKYQLSADGRRFVVQSSDDNGAIWDITNHSPIIDLGTRGDMKAFYLMDKAHVVLTERSDNSVTAWDTTIGRQIFNTPAKVFGTGAWDEDNKRLITLSEDGTCLLWNLTTGAQIAGIGVPFETDSIYSVHREDVGRFVTRLRTGTVELWDSADGHKVAGLDPATPVASLTVNNEAMRIAAITTSGELSLFDAVSGTMLAHIIGHPRILGLGFSSDGKRLITREIENRLRLWNAVDGTELGYIGNSSATNWNFSTNGQLILLRGPSGADLFRAENGKLLLKFAKPNLRTFTFSERGDRLAVTDYDGQATLWDVSEGDRDPNARNIAQLAGDESGTTFVDDTTFSADGRRLVVSSDASLGGLWDSEHGRKIRAFHTLGEAIDEKFSADMKVLATTGSNNDGSILDGLTGDRLGIAGGEGAVYQIGLSADGQRFATQSLGDTAAVWDTSQRVPDDAPAADVRDLVCQLNYSAVGVFDREQLDDDSELTQNTRFRVVGRPWNPCDWRGLRNLEGWAQALRYWLVRAGLPWDYICGETTAFASSSSIGSCPPYPRVEIQMGGDQSDRSSRHKGH